MQIRGRTIGPSHPPYVIAEVSCNHAGSEAVAHALIQVAKGAGAEAVKFQFYTPEGMVGPLKVVGGDARTTGNTHIVLGDTPIKDGPWDGIGMWALYAQSQMPWEWGPRLKERCHSLGLAFIASAYEADGLAWLMKECVPDALKVASFEATDYTLLRACFDTKLPVIVSTGMLTDAEVTDIYLTAADSGTTLLILHCVSAYPAPSRGSIYGLPTRFTPSTNRLCGFSDHTLGSVAACAAVAHKACAVEKHIQLHPSLKTADSHFSLTPDDFKAYCSAVNEAWQACQPPVGDVEASSRQFRRAPGGKRGSYPQGEPR